MAVFWKLSTKQLSQLNRCLYWKPLRISTPLEATQTSIDRAFEKFYSTNKTSDVDDLQPVRFTTSEASKWRAEFSRMGAKEDDCPPSQPYFVTFSLAVFMIYFFYLREENDIDIKLGGGGFGNTGTYLEFIQLKTIVEQNTKDGVQTDEAIVNRLRELEKLGTLPA